MRALARLLGWLRHTDPPDGRADTSPPPPAVFCTGGAR